MRIVVVTPPDAIVSLDEAKAHLRLTGTAADPLVQACLETAQSQLDGPDGWLGRAIGPQTLELQDLSSLASDGCSWLGGSGRVALPCPPLTSIVSIVYGAAAITIDPSLYVTSGDGVQPVMGQTWPWSWVDLPSARIRYVAGYAIVPAPIRMALLLLAQDLFLLGARDPSLTVDTVYGVGSQQFAQGRTPVLGPAAEALLSPYRIFA